MFIASSAIKERLFNAKIMTAESESGVPISTDEKFAELVQDIIIRMGKVTDADLDALRSRMTDDGKAKFDRADRISKVRLFIMSSLTSEERVMVSRARAIPVLHDLRSFWLLDRFFNSD